MKPNIRELKKIGTWLLDGDTGLSSLSMAAVYLGGSPKQIHHPHDVSDLKRCYEFLDSCVDKSRHYDLIYQMAEKTEQWKLLKDEWFVLKNLYLSEYKTGNCPKTYEFMQKWNF